MGFYVNIEMEDFFNKHAVLNEDSPSLIEDINEVSFLERKNLNIFTKISFLIAIATISVVLLSLFTSMMTLNKSIASIMQILVLLIFLCSVFSIPLSIISMFSTENLAKRFFSLIVNLLPISIIVYSLVMEFIDEFFRTAS